MAPNRLMPPRWCAVLAGVAALVLTAPARAGINIGTTDASDGAFNPTANVVVDLSQAVTGTWDQDNTANTGKGVYDPVKWAVVFKYSSVNIPAGVTVTFKNHPSGAPVVWLVQGDVTIAGTVNLNGAVGSTTGSLVVPGPGGFAGGAGYTSVTSRSAGFGPGGGSLAGAPSNGTGGGYGSAGGVYNGGLPGSTYGNAQILPLLGGSGGTGWIDQGPPIPARDGNAGGGAILIASANAIVILGELQAKAGVGVDNPGGGSGGAIRLVSDALSGSGQVQATGTPVAAKGGDGRIRLEANTLSLSGTVTPTPATLQPVGQPVIWPPDTIPSLTMSQIAGKPVPADPHAVLDSADHYTTVASVQPITVRLDARNVPLTWNVVLRVVPFSGPDFTVNATNVSGDATASVWEATVTVPMGASAFQARAYKP